MPGQGLWGNIGKKVEISLRKLNCFGTVPVAYIHLNKNNLGRFIFEWHDHAFVYQKSIHGIWFASGWWMKGQVCNFYCHVANGITSRRIYFRVGYENKLCQIQKATLLSYKGSH